MRDKGHVDGCQVSDGEYGGLLMGVMSMLVAGKGLSGLTKGFIVPSNYKFDASAWQL